MSAASDAPSRSSPPGIKRLAIVLAVVVYLLAGVPAWWKLTEVYRTPLPFQEIETLASENVILPCELQVVLSSQKVELDLEGFRSGLEKAVTGSGCGCELDLVVTLDTETGCVSKGGAENATEWRCGISGSGISSLRPDQEVDEALHDYVRGVNEKAGRYTIIAFLEDRNFCLARSWLGKYRHAWITGCGNSDLKEVLKTIAEAAKAMLGSGVGTSEVMPLAADGTVTLSFSLLNANPNGWIYDWDFPDLQERFLEPVIQALAPAARLSVESQVLYYTPSNGRSQWEEDEHSYVIDSKDLPFFVNSKEWHLDTSTAAAGRSKVLHFAIYVPAANETPLRFRLPDGQLSPTNAFTSKGWGGVVVWNSTQKAGQKNQRLNRKDLEQTMEVFIAQLRTLFGIPLSPPDTSVIPNVETGFSEWEVDILLRRRSTADIYASVSTLASLSRLVKHLPNMVVQDEIGEQVHTALDAVGTARQVPSYAVFSEMAREAKAWAEAAFFHPSIMSLLHFPKEHLLAIYTPFFVPVLIHTFASLTKELRRFFRERRKYRQV